MIKNLKLLIVCSAFILFLFGGCSGSDMINVEITDNAGMAGSSLAKVLVFGDGTLTSDEKSEYIERGVVKVSDVKGWSETSSGQYSGTKDGKDYETIDAEGARAVSSYLKWNF